MKIIETQDFKVRLINGGEYLNSAQLLRGRIFLRQEKTEKDKFDKFCQHLVVIDKRINQVVGTYRLLLGSIAEKNIGFYSETEFDLGNIKRSCKGEVLEIGRACVHPDYRKYLIITLLWRGVLSYVEYNKVDFIFGCASIEDSHPLKIGKIFRFFKDNFFSPPRFRVFPLEDKRFSYIKYLDEYNKEEVLNMLTSLIRGYLSIGAFVCGEPAWDRVFDTVDFFMLLDVKRINNSFLRKFL
ncbi:MAG: hemolysin [Candidatus Omnitrophota bacterium]|nr:MAG: hemolysin [Candidatus Omnitrophota bacterium]RKY43355.1 MAG: hemolysin [Candidatus Omnitrophota bacterium]